MVSACAIRCARTTRSFEVRVAWKSLGLGLPDRENKGRKMWNAAGPRRLLLAPERDNTPAVACMMESQKKLENAETLANLDI